MALLFSAYDQDFVDSTRAGGADANGQPAETAVSDGRDNPCRSCLRPISEGAEMLILAARPFPDLQPYAETGPIFLCAEACGPWDGTGVPPVLQSSANYLLKGYDANNRIVYGTGAIIAAARLLDYAAELLNDDRVAYVDVRSARNNCFLTRITGG